MTYDIDLLKLPSVLFESLADVPEITAVYFALAESGEVLYVGVARNRRERWQGHHHWHVLQVSQLTVRSFWKFISKNWKFNFEEQRTFNAGSIVLWTTAHLADKRPENTIRKMDKSSNRRKYNTL
jgi:hypothetical protein